MQLCTYMAVGYTWPVKVFSCMLTNSCSVSHVVRYTDLEFGKKRALCIVGQFYLFVIVFLFL